MIRLPGKNNCPDKEDQARRHLEKASIDFAHMTPEQSEFLDAVVADLGWDCEAGPRKVGGFWNGMKVCGKSAVEATVEADFSSPTSYAD